METEKTPLLSVINNVQTLISKYTYLFCNNEMNVRIEIVEPILKALGWDFLDLNREKTCKRKRADYALYKDGYCFTVIEVKSIEKELNKCDEIQLFNYVSRLNASYGILTNGYIWQIRDNKEGIVIKSIDLLNSENGKIESFFRCFDKNAFCKVPIKDTFFCESTDWNQPFFIRGNDFRIEKEDPTNTFVEFIIKYIDLVFELQQNNRFEKKFVSPNKADFKTTRGQKRTEPKKIQYNGKILYITKDHNTYFKRFVIQQIIVEGSINATIEPQLP